MWKVQIIESERGWGSKVDGERKFDTYEEALTFQTEYNQSNVDDWNKTKRVPDWYMRASEPYEV